MAELSDWLNRTVLRLSSTNFSLAEPIAEVRVVFQRNVIVDNTIGWAPKPCAEIVVPEFRFDAEAIREFTEAARK